MRKAAEAQNTNSLPDFVAQNKALLQQHYVPAIEKKEVPKIESEDKPEPVQLTEEQLEERNECLRRQKEDFRWQSIVKLYRGLKRNF